jgi:NADPH:quinone reductase-like Zn-dependent oxidoreductase
VFLGLVKNQTILVQGGGGVVAHFAIQFAKYGLAKANGV